jgi:hypothetical protein
VPIFASSKNETIELKAICDDFDGGSFTAALDIGVKEMKTRRPDLNIEIDYTQSRVPICSSCTS